MHLFLKLLIFIFLCSCSEKVEFPTPAESHIEEYTAKLQSCQADKSKTIHPGKNSKEKGENEQPPNVNPIFHIKPSDMVFGDAGSKVVIIEYFSLTCPHCAHFHKTIFPGIKERYIDTGRIAYVIRDFVGNRQDLDGSILARCPGGPDKYFQFVSVLLEHQDNWAFSRHYREHLVRLGELGGIPADLYQECLEDSEISSLLVENAKEISRYPSFQGTPTFFINGKQYTSAYTLEALSKAIEEAFPSN